MANLPVSVQNDVVIQNNTTGQVDYLQFQGSVLTHSTMFDYGIGGMNIVGHGPVLNSNEGLVVQNPTTGVVDFLGLDAQGNLVSSALSTSLPRIIGEATTASGGFGGAVAGQSGPILVSQLANGQLDFLAFNSSGAVISSDLVANSIGLPHAVGVADASSSNTDFRPFLNNGAVSTDENVIVQLADGSLDAIGFSGTFPAGNINVSNSYLLPGTAGIGAVGAINPDQHAPGDNANNRDASGTEGVQMVSQLASGQLDFMNFDSGYSDAANEGVLYASTLLNPSFPGWHVVDAGLVATNVLPIT
jgi:hypothetical protein